MGPTIYHFFFVDDLVLFCKANEKKLELLWKFWAIFVQCQAKKLVLKKSKAYFALSVSRRKMNALSMICGMSGMENLGKYLGIPLVHGIVKKQHFDHIIDKIHMKLSGGKLSISHLWEELPLFKLSLFHS